MFNPNEPIDQDIVTLAKAIRQKESGGNYEARGGSGEYGAYQFMPETWKNAAKNVLGDENAPMTRENQNKVMYARLKEKKDAGWNIGQIASWHNSGSPDNYNNNHRGINKFGVKYDTPAYAAAVASLYKQFKSGNPAENIYAHKNVVQVNQNQFTPKTTIATPNTQSVETTPPQKKTIGGFLNNVVNSAVEAGKGLYQTVRHPVKTAESLGNIILGTAENASQYIYSRAPGTQNIAEKKPTKAQETANAAGQYFKQRYGSKQAIKDTVYNDPVGAVFDLATVLDAGAGTVGKVGDITKIEQLNKAANVISKISETINPLNTPGKIIKGASKTLANPISKYLAKSADTEAIASAEKLGINLPPAATTKSPTLQKVIKSTEEGFSGEKLRKATNLAKEQLSQSIENLQNKITPENVVSREIVGQEIKNGFNKFKTNFDNTKEALYNEVLPQAKGKTAIVDKTKEVLQDIIKQKQAALGVADPGEIKEFQRILSSIDGKQVNFENLRAMRTEIGKMKTARGFAPELKRLYSALSEDLDNTAKAINPETAKKIAEADAFYKENIQKIQSSIGKSVLKSNPENIVKNIVKPNNVTNLRLLKTLVGEDSFQYIGSSFMTDSIKNAMKNGEFDLNKFKRIITKYDEPTLKEILTPEQFDNLQEVIRANDDVQLVSDALKRGSRLGLTGTAIQLGKGMEMVKLFFSKPLYLLGSLVGEKALSEFLISPEGRKFITGIGLNKEDVSKLFNQATRLKPKTLRSKFLNAKSFTRGSVAGRISNGVEDYLPSPQGNAEVSDQAQQ